MQYPIHENQTSTIVVVTLPNQLRVYRKFFHSDLGNEIYIWIAHQECLRKNEIYVYDFILIGTFGELVKKTLHLAIRDSRRKSS